MAFDDRHRNFVRLAVESACQKFLWDPGMCGRGGAFDPSSGGVMPVGGSVIFVRPRKRLLRPYQESSGEVDTDAGPAAKIVRNSFTDEHPGETSSTDEEKMQNSVSGLATQFVANILSDIPTEVRGSEKVMGTSLELPPEGSPTLPSDMREATDGKDFEDLAPASGTAGKVDAHESANGVASVAHLTDFVGAGGDDSKAAKATQPGDDVKSSQGIERKIVEGEEEEAEGVVRFRDGGSGDGPPCLSGVSGCTGLENGESMSAKSDARNDSYGETVPESVGHARPELSVLSALLLDMTRAAEEWSARLPKAVTSGKSPSHSCFTTIILLDAPLASREYTQRASHNDDHSEVGSSLTASEHSPTPQGADFVDPPSSEISSDVEPDVSSAASGETHDDGNTANTMGSFKEHPAGLGDPDDALEALLSWVNEGGSSCSSRRREVILVCGNQATDAGGMVEETLCKARILAKNAQGDGMAEEERQIRTHDIVREGGVIHHGQTPRVEDDHSNMLKQGETLDDSDGVIATASKRCPRYDPLGNGPKEDDCWKDRKAAGENSVVRPPIRQIILERPRTRPQHAKATPSRADAESNDHQESLRDLSTVYTEKIGTDGSGSRQVPANVSPLPSHPLMPPVTPRQPSPLVMHPPEVLIGIRLESTATLDQIELMFPPPSVSPRGPGESDVAVERQKESDGGASLGGTKSSSTAAAHTGEQTPRVLVGPVIGRVGPKSAVVLVEVGSARRSTATPRVDPRVALMASDLVVVQLTDIFTGRAQVIAGGRWAGQPGSGPRVFEFENLTPGRRYVVRLLGVCERDQVSIKTRGARHKQSRVSAQCSKEFASKDNVVPMAAPP